MFTPGIARKTSRTPNLHAPTLIPKTLQEAPLAAPPALGDSETPFDDAEWPEVGFETQEILRGNITERPEPEASGSFDDLPDMEEETFETDFVERKFSDTPAPVDHRTGTESDPAFGFFPESEEPGWGSTSGDDNAQFGAWNDLDNDEFDDEVYARKRGAPTLLIAVGIGLLLIMIAAAAALVLIPGTEKAETPVPEVTPLPPEPAPAPTPSTEEAAEATPPTPAAEEAAEPAPTPATGPKKPVRRRASTRSAPKAAPAAPSSRPTRIEPDRKAEKKSLLDRLRRGPSIKAKPMEEADAAPEAEDVWGAAPAE